MVSSWSNTAEQSGLPLSRRRFLVLSLPRWATDCLRRAEPGIDRPLVLWERQRGAMRLAAVDGLAAEKGLFVGQNLSDARALVPGLEAREIDRPWTEQVFADFADWHSNASPVVAVLADAAPYGDLCLDIAGVTHLFGGEEKMLAALVGRLERLGFTVAGAIADTIGAAWGLARFAPGRIVAESGLSAALAELPVAALRLGESQVEGLNQMGLKRVGQLYGRDRKALQARFGASLITRLDQALGRIGERLVPRVPMVEFYAERRFAEPIGLIDDVLSCAADLAIRLADRLEGANLGAQTFHLFLYRVDHKVMDLSVNAARATRDPGHIARLFQHRAERLAGEYDPGFGIDMIRLAASSVSDLTSTQIGAFETDDGAEDLDRLYDRITSRLGPLALVRSRPVDTHIPEQAIRLEPVVACTPVDPAALPDPALIRPLRLLPAPEAITVLAEVPDGPPVSMTWRRIGYRFVKASGPERIEAEWWRSGQRLELLPPARRSEESKVQPGGGAPTAKLQPFEADAVLRDYYIAEDEGGRRFWLFRQGLFGAGTAPLWFMHGIFS